MTNNYVGFFYTERIIELNLIILIYLPLLDANKSQSCITRVYLALSFSVDFLLALFFSVSSSSTTIIIFATCQSFKTLLCYSKIFYIIFLYFMIFQVFHV